MLLIRTTHFTYRFYDHSYFISNYSLYPNPLDANRHLILTYIAHNSAEYGRFRDAQRRLKELIPSLEAQAATSCFAWGVQMDRLIERMQELVEELESMKWVVDRAYHDFLYWKINCPCGWCGM
ncbi:MAG: hypothetical protein Q9208_005549 [Pyrenodesmia sp. 3 TL-2023]